MFWSGQGLFLPRAKFKQRETESSRLFFAWHGGDLCVGKLSWIYMQVKKPFLLGRDESIWPCIEAVKSISCHMRGLKQREQARTTCLPFFHSFVCI